MSEGVHYSVGNRYKGALDIAVSSGLELQPLYLDWSTGIDQSGYSEKIKREVKEISNVITSDCGVVADSQSISEWLKDGAAACGMRMGMDFGVISCDSGGNWPMLTRIEFDRYQLGADAASMLLKLIEKPGKKVPSHRFPVGNLIVGNTCPGPRKPGEERDPAEFMSHG